MDTDADGIWCFVSIFLLALGKHIWELSWFPSFEKLCVLWDCEMLNLSVMTNIHKLNKLSSVVSQFSLEASYVHDIS